MSLASNCVLRLRPAHNAGLRSGCRSFFRDYRFQPVQNSCLDLIPHAATCRELLFVAADACCGVVKRPIETRRNSGKDGTAILGVAAHGDDGAEVRLAQELKHILERCPAGRSLSRPSLGAVNGLISFGSNPALKTSNRSPPYRLRNASAIWLRAEFPVQMNKTQLLHRLQSLSVPKHNIL